MLLRNLYSTNGEQEGNPVDPNICQFVCKLKKNYSNPSLIHYLHRLFPDQLMVPNFSLSFLKFHLE